MNEWIEKWRIMPGSLLAQKVRVLPVTRNYVLVEGEDHTSYDGGFFDTVEEAYAWELADVERTLRWATDTKEKILARMADSQDPEKSKGG